MQFVFWVPIANGADVPKHKCMGGYDPKTGDVYLSADVVGGKVNTEQNMLYNNNHLYCPSEWLKQHFPEYKERITIFANMVLDLTLFLEERCTLIQNQK